MKIDSMTLTSYETWMPEARQIAAQCWCDDATKNTVMDTVLAEAVAKRIATWMETAAQHCRNESYYRGLLVRCGNAIGESAKTCDDGSKSEGVLCAKVPELVEALRAALVIADKNLDDIDTAGDRFRPEQTPYFKYVADKCRENVKVWRAALGEKDGPVFEVPSAK